MNLRGNKTLLLLLSTVSISNSACPHSSSSQINSISPPNDSQHQNLRQRRRLATLTSHPETREAISDIVSHRRRSLQSSSAFTCLSTTVYNAIKDDVANIALNIIDLGDRGHFLGGILRLAAHDFMDYDMTDETNPGGSNGCLDLTHNNNAGLSSIWCDNDAVDPIACPFKYLYDELYSTVMSRADYWVAGANAVIAFSSQQSLDLPFQWGRVDQDVCLESSDRLPADDGCDAVKGVFLDRMGLSWTDAVALLGGHTLGRGDENFSGHPGFWVPSAEGSTVFDKAYYTELVNRAWRPRMVAGGAQDWTWGGPDLSVMMLNADICLYFDIPDGNTQNCCTNTERNCGGVFEDVQCNTTELVRPEAKTAVDNFMRGGLDDNEAFFDAFTSAWGKATQMGNENTLKDLQPTCMLTPVPTGAHTVSTAPTDAPVTLMPTTECQDKDFFVDRRGMKRDCAWVLSRNGCERFAEECPKTCGGCGTTTE